MSAPEVVVSPTETELASSVATRTVAKLAAAQRERGSASVVVTGGGILEKVFTAIAEQSDRSVDWSAVDVYWGDERFVPSDSPDRNDVAVRRLLLDKLPFADERIFPMPPSDGPDGDDVDAAARRYAELIPDRFDVVLLGIGPDGHCCSLFPDHPCVYVRDESVIAVRDSPKPPPTRISLTFESLATADEVWVIAAGDGKAGAAAQALGGADPTKIPSAGARGRERTIWFLDRAAASQLPS